MKLSEIPPECPKYRVRLFLSVDLTNSTSFRSSRPPHSWVPIFRDFYSQFAESFKRNHIEVTDLANTENANINPCDVKYLQGKEPRFWKTVGDEIIFVNRVDSCFEVFFLVKAFIKALQEYGVALSGEKETESLGVKGSGWIASFPYPNIAIEMPRHSCDANSGLSEREEIEESADKDPAMHEFLGKGLDYGFRIASNSTNDFMAISPALADVISRANVNEDYSNLGAKIRIKPPVKLKGVLNGMDYPVVGIPIDRTPKWSEFRELQDKLLGSDQSNDQDLRSYFRHFMELYDIEEPLLMVRPSEKAQEPPKYYTERYVPKWVEAYKEVEDQDAMISEGEHANNDSEAEIKHEELRVIIEKLFGPRSPT